MARKAPQAMSCAAGLHTPGNLLGAQIPGAFPFFFFFWFCVTGFLCIAPAELTEICMPLLQSAGSRHVPSHLAIEDFFSEIILISISREWD